MNGYYNLGCRCDVCRQATTDWHRQTYAKLDVGVAHVDADRPFHARFKSYAAARGESMRQIALRAISEYMERNP